jgi:hypothetical protein
LQYLSGILNHRYVHKYGNFVSFEGVLIKVNEKTGMKT